MSGPLEGIRVVDVSQVMSGPIAAMMLADQGADVIKVEPPDGDMIRQSAAFSRGGLPALFLNCNRNKRSIAVDVATPAGLKVVHELAAQADVFIENWRPGAADRVGLGEEQLRALNDDLIYCSLSGFGPTGPYSKRRAYDPIIQGLTGAPDVQRNPEFPLPDLVRHVFVDKSAAYVAAQAISAALFARERGAGGQHIEVPLIDVSLAFFWPDGMQEKTYFDDEIADRSNADAFRLWYTKDGQIIYLTASQREHEALSRALDRPEWIDDPRFATPQARARPENLIALGPLIAEAIASFTTAELLARMNEHEVACGPVLTRSEVLEDPQIVHNETVLEFEHPTAGKYRQARPAARFDVTPQTPRRRAAPLLSEHADEILAELSYSVDEVAALRSDGVVT